MPFVRSDGTRPARKTTRQPDVAGRFIKRVEPRSTSRKTASTHRSHSGAGAPHVPSPATPLRRRPELGLPSKCRSTVTIHSLHGSSMSEPQPYSIMSHVDEVPESPGLTSPVVGLSSVMTDVSAIHEHTSTPTRSGSGFRLDLDRPSIWIGMVAATRSGHVLGDTGRGPPRRWNRGQNFVGPASTSSNKHTGNSHSSNSLAHAR